MNPWIRRSLKVGLLAGGFVCIGTGIASARGSSPAPAVSSSSDLTHVVARQVPLLDQATKPLNPVKSDPAGSVLGDATKLVTSVTGSLAPPSGIQPLLNTPPAAVKAGSPASGAVSISAHGSASPDTGASLDVSVSVGSLGKWVTVTASAGSSSPVPHVTLTSGAPATPAATTARAGSKSASLVGSVPVLGKALFGSGSAQAGGSVSPDGSTIAGWGSSEFSGGVSPDGPAVSGSSSAAVSSITTPGGPVLDGSGSLSLGGSLPAVPTDGLPGLDSLTSALPTGLPSLDSLPGLDSLTSALPTGLPSLDSLTSALPLSGLPSVGNLTSALPLSGLTSALPSFDSLTSVLPISGFTSALPLGGLPVSLPI